MASAALLVYLRTMPCQCAIGLHALYLVTFVHHAIAVAAPSDHHIMQQRLEAIRCRKLTVANDGG